MLAFVARAQFPVNYNYELLQLRQYWYVHFVPHIIHCCRLTIFKARQLIELCIKAK